MFDELAMPNRAINGDRCLMHRLRNILTFLLTMTVISGAGLAESPLVFSDGEGAIRGYDAVAYFTDGKPVRGDGEFSHDWMGTTWYFSTAENRDTFVMDPAAYAPQYGGYCAWAASQGYVAATDPTAWTIHEGKLYLNFNHRVHRRWSRDIEGNVQKGDRNWPSILE